MFSNSGSHGVLIVLSPQPQLFFAVEEVLNGRRLMSETSEEPTEAGAFELMVLIPSTTGFDAWPRERMAVLTIPPNGAQSRMVDALDGRG